MQYSTMQQGKKGEIIVPQAMPKWGKFLVKPNNKKTAKGRSFWA
ncbi:hypothetical protein [Moraxella cuniculi]|nr:hypothetical protein [Moraxella cuniculi]